jgi:hypothetical protein
MCWIRSRAGRAAPCGLALFRVDGPDRTLLKEAVTNDDGRVDQPLLEGEAMGRGTYELVFQSAHYFKLQGVDLPKPGLPRRGADPLRHRRGGALPRPAPGLALRLFHLPGELMRRDAGALPPGPRAGGARGRRPDAHRARLAARGAAPAGGTKEGCAEGDCGACTVIVAEPEDGRLRYERGQRLHPASADPRRLPALTTVEDLKAGPDGTLHPVQQAMVEAPRLAMRLLHAGLRDEPVRAAPRGARPPERGSTTRSPATSAAAPATGRSSTPPGDARPRLRTRASCAREPARSALLAVAAATTPRAWTARPAPFFARGTLDELGRPRGPPGAASSSRARPTWGCGSPSSSPPRDGDLARPGRELRRSRRRDTAVEIGAGVTYAARRSRYARPLWPRTSAS